MTPTAITPDQFSSFGELLKYLRRQARITQRELAIAVGYSDTQISRIEQNQRVPGNPTYAAPPNMPSFTAIPNVPFFLDMTCRCLDNPCEINSNLVAKFSVIAEENLKTVIL